MTDSPPPVESRARLALSLDCLATLLLLTSLIIAHTGGLRVLIAGTVISARGAARPLLAAIAVVALRAWLAPRTPPFRSTLADWQRRWSRVYRRDADERRDAGLAFSLRRTTIAGLGMCAAAFILLYTQLTHLYSVPDFGDPFLSMWRIGWVYEQLRGDPRPLFDANIFYPEPLTLTYSDSMLLPGATAAPLLAVGVHPVVAYNLLFVSGFVLSGIAAYLLVEHLTGSPPAAFVSGLVYGFYPYHFEHYSHLELQMMQWIPLALLAMHRLLETTRGKYAIAVVICVAAQLYSSMYYGVFLCVYAATLAMVLLLAIRPPFRRLAIPCASAAVLGLLVASPLARAYVASTERRGTRERQEIEYFSATPSDFLRAHYRSVPYGRRTLPGRKPERALFPGLVPIALTAAGLIPPLGVARLAYFVGLATAFDGSLGFNGVSYPYLYEWLAPVRGLRVPARYSVFVAMSLAVLSGFGVRRLLARGRTRPARTAILGTLVGACLVNAWSELELRPVWPAPPPIYGPIASTPARPMRAPGDPASARNVVLVEFPLEENYAQNARFMYFSLWHWASMINGYSGFMPKSYDEFEHDVRGFPAPHTIETMRARGVTHVSVNCAFYRGGCDQLLERIEALPDFRTVAAGRWQGSSVRLYELIR